MSYDAFVSYNHAADSKLAPALQSGLERIAKPWYRLRTLRIFRDETNLSVHPDLWGVIENALNQSSYFVLLASPEAARSKWVQREVAWWLKNRSINTIILVVTDGVLRWDESHKKFDSVASSALPPALVDGFSTEPLFIDMSWAKETDDVAQDPHRFQTAVRSIAARIKGISPSELDSEAMRALRRNRVWAGSAIVTLCITTIWALMSRDISLRNADLARSELSVERVNALSQTKNQANALVVAIDAADSAMKALNPSPLSVISALRYGIESSREVRRWKVEDQISGVAFDVDSASIICVTRNDKVFRIRLPSGEPEPIELLTNKKPLVLRGEDSNLRITENRAAIEVLTKGDGHRFFALNGSSLANGRELHGVAFYVSPNNDRIYALSNDGRISHFDDTKEHFFTLRLPAPLDVKAIYLSRDEKYLLRVSQSGRIDIFEAASGHVRTVNQACRDVVTYANKSDTLISAGCGRVRLLSTLSAEELELEVETASLVKDIVTDPAGNFAFRSGQGEGFNLFLTGGMPLLLKLIGSDGPSAAFSSDGKWLVMSGYLDRTIRLFDIGDRTAKRIHETKSGRMLTAMDVCEDSSSIVLATDDGNISIVDYVRPDVNRRSWHASDNYLETARCVYGGVVTADRGGKVIYWPQDGFHFLITSEGPKGRAIVGTSRNGKWIYVPQGGDILRWKFDSRPVQQPPLRNPIHSSAWWQILAGSGDRKIAIGSSEGEIAILDAYTNAIVFGPKKVQPINVWNLSPDINDKGFTANGPSGEITALDWTGNSLGGFRKDRFIFGSDAPFDSKNGLLAVPSLDSTIEVVDFENRRVGPMISVGEATMPMFMRFTRDRYLIVGKGPRLVRYDFDPERLFSMACDILARRGILDGEDSQYQSLRQHAKDACEARTPKR